MATIQKISLVHNSIDNIVEVFVSNGSGKGVTGIAFGDVDIRAWAMGEAGGETTGNPIAGTIDTFVSNGWIEVDGTNLAGYYQYSIPNVFLQSNSSNLYISFEITGASNKNILLEINLVASPSYLGYKLSADGLDAIPIEGFNLREALILMASVLCGETAGAETNKTIFKALGDNATQRLTSETSDNTNRTDVQTFV